MRHTVKRLMALFVALLLALTGVLPVSVFAEDAEDGIVALGNGSPEDLIEVPDGVVDMENAPTVGETGEIPSLELSDDLSLDLLAEDAPQSAPEAVVTYCFIADDAPVATQAAWEGDAIQRPADPSAPEGYAFIGWFLEDGAPLFVDADGDGAIDPIIAHPDPLCPQIVVTARFEGQSVPSEGEQSPAEGEDVEAPAEEETEESTEGENDQPAEDETEVPAEQPAEGDDAQEPSPSGHL